MAERSNPIGFEAQITRDGGYPTDFFIQQWQSQLNANEYAFNEIVAGDGLDGGGALADGEVTFNLETLDPAPTGTYGSAGEVPVITVDKHGRTTVVSTAAVTAVVGVEDDGVNLGNFSIFNFVGTEWTLTDAGSGQLNIEVSGGGGGGGSGSFGGIMISDGGFATFADASATKGFPFMPTQDVTVAAVNALIDPASTSETYTAQIVEFSAGNSGGSVTALVATSDAQTAVDTQFGVYRFTFPSTVTLDRGTIYLVAINRTDGTGTDALIMRGDGDVVQSGPFVSYSNGTQYFDTTSLAVSDSNDGGTVISELGLWIECQ